MEPYKNILIIKMSSLGDVLHALPTLHALRQNCPQARIVWAVHENFPHFYRKSLLLTTLSTWIRRS